MTAPTVRQAKILRLMSLIHILMNEPLSIKRISERLDIHERNAYRYLRLIDQLGIEVKTEKKSIKRYYIEQCPCCGKMKAAQDWANNFVEISYKDL